MIEVGDLMLDEDGTRMVCTSVSNIESVWLREDWQSRVRYFAVPTLRAREPAPATSLVDSLSAAPAATVLPPDPPSVVPTAAVRAPLSSGLLVAAGTVAGAGIVELIHLVT